MENVRGIAKCFLKYSKYREDMLRYLSWAFGKSEMATVWFDLIDSTSS